MLKKKKWRDSLVQNFLQSNQRKSKRSSVGFPSGSHIFQAVISWGGELYRTVNVTLSIIIVHIDYCSVLFKSFKYSQFNTVLSNTYFPKTWRHTRVCIQ